MSANSQWRDSANDDEDLSELAVDAALEWEARVMGRIATGDDAAMMTLYDRYSTLVFSVAVHLLGDHDLAEDVAQEVFLNIWRSPCCFSSSRGRLGSWLAVVTRHRAIDILRKRRRECSIEIEAADGKWQNQIELSEAAGKIAAMLPSLPASQRGALGLAYFRGLSHSEISSRTGEPLGTVKSRIRLALEFLRKTLAHAEPVKYPVPIHPAPRADRK